MKFTCVLAALLLGSAISQNVVEVAVSLPNTFSSLVDILITAGLDDSLSTAQDITVFAPTDGAFEKLHQSSLQLLQTEQWRLHLQNFLLQHVLPLKVPSSAISEGLRTDALNGEEVKFNVSTSGGVIVNDIASVVQADVSADNGVIHVVDTVLFPEWVSNNIVDRASGDPELTILTRLIHGLHLTRPLAFHGPYTVFAPSDVSFIDALDVLGIQNGILSASLASTLVTYHVVHGIYTAAEIVDGLELMTAQGEEIQFSFDGDIPQVNGANIVSADILASNGIVHKIDAVMIPKSVLSTPEADPQTVIDVAISNSDTFSSLVNLVVQADLVDPLSTTQGITVFAPTNDAFAIITDAAPEIVANLQTEQWSAHLKNLMLYHILPVQVLSSAVTDGLTATALNGEDISFTANTGIFVNFDSEVVLADVDASNGVIHAIDNVLIPSWVSNSIVDRAIGSSVLTTLVDLLVKAGLVDSLAGAGPFTVFAPTNDAFVEFLGDDVANTASLDIELLSSILTYHVVPGIYAASDIANGVSLTTLQGEEISLSLMGNTAMVNGEIVVTADILANNGVVHVIDGVLVPNEATAFKMVQASFVEPQDQLTLSLMESEEKSSSGSRFSIATLMATLVSIGVVVGNNF